MSVILSFQQIYDIRFAYHVSGEPVLHLSIIYHISQDSVLDIVLFRKCIIKEHLSLLIPHWKRKFERFLTEIAYGKYPATEITDEQLAIFFSDERLMERWMKVKHPDIYDVWISDRASIAC